MKGSCPCGAVSVTLGHPPESLNSCDCSLCFRLGALWGYFEPADVTIEGKTETFVRSDIEAWLEIHFCPSCGATINWSSITEPRLPRMGVNMRLFGPDALLGIPVRFSDGRNWNDKAERPGSRHAEVPFAHDNPF